MSFSYYRMLFSYYRASFLPCYENYMVNYTIINVHFSPVTTKSKNNAIVICRVQKKAVSLQPLLEESMNQ